MMGKGKERGDEETEEMFTPPVPREFLDATLHMLTGSICSLGPLKPWRVLQRSDAANGI